MVKQSHRQCRIGSIVVLLVGLFLMPIRAAELQVLQGHVPAAVAQLQPLTPLDGTKTLKLVIGLPLRDQAGLSKLLNELYDPASPNYRHYLKPGEFADRFGPAPADYQALSDFMKTNGLRVSGTHPNRVILEVEGSVADIERTLHVTLHEYQHPLEARKFYAPDREPALDLAVPILHIAGLDNYSLPHPNFRRGPKTPPVHVTPHAGTQGGEYYGNDFRAAYVPGSSLNGTGQSVALLEYDGYYASDIANYESLGGLPAVTLTNILVNGGPVTPGDGDTEVSLDIEMAISMAPSLSKILVYEGTNGVTAWATILNTIATDDLANQVSCSWSGGGPDPTSEQIFRQMAAQGQSFFNAVGDSDAFTGAISFPSDSTNVTECGGTTLSTAGPGSNYVSETVWNWYVEYGSSENGVGSSGGISAYYAIPPWQTGISMTANKGSTTRRNVPDVSLTADHVFVAAENGGTGWVGGTSCAAPLWAAYTALVNQQAVSNGVGKVGFLNPALYAIGKSANYTNCFHDITTGNNEWTGSTTKYAAVTGYDLCTGWGSPNGTNLINALAPVSLPPARLTVSPGTLAYGALAIGQSSTQIFSVINLGGSALTGSVSAASPFAIIDGSPYNVAVGRTGTVSVSFRPTVAGSFSNKVVFLGNGGSSTNLVTGMAAGLTPPQLKILPGSLNYGTLTVGESSTLTFSVVNLGASALTGSVSVASPFAVAAGSPYNVAGGRTGIVSVSFSPTLAGSFSNEVVFIGNGGRSTNLVIGVAAGRKRMLEANAIGSANPATGSTDRQVLQGHVPEAVTRLQPLNRLDPTKTLKLVIGLPLRDQAGLNQLLHDLYDPASPNYRHYLKPGEFAERFGPAPTDYQALVDFAKTNGLRISATHSNREILEVAGSVADIERTLHVTLNEYQHPLETRHFYAPDREPALDLAVPVLHIAGLDNYSLPHPNYRREPKTPPVQVTPHAGSEGGEYYGKDYRVAYVPGSPLAGSGQSVALLEYDGYYTSDITTYESLGGLPAVTLTNILINGGPVIPGGGDTEVSLDIEVAISMAPSLSKILVYEGTNGVTAWATILDAIATDDLASQISCSWSGGGPDPTSEQYFQQMAAQGQTFFNAVGDSDAFTGAISFPSDSTNITECGGTTLSTAGPGSNYVSETVWNWGVEYGSSENGVGSSGGVSTYYSIPPWQTGISMTTNKGSTTKRNVPDVALTADHVFVVAGNGGTGWVGGTSCAAPLWAGFTALVNQQAAANGAGKVGFLNPAVYAIGKSANYTNCFHDVTSGNNEWTGSTTKYAAVTGYDLCTGWGTPTGTNLINALVPPTSTNAELSVNPGALVYSSLIIGQSSTQNFLVINLGPAALTGSVSVASPFSVIAGSPYTIGSGATGTVSIAFNPVASGTLSKNVIYIGNGGSSTNLVTGTGLTPPQLSVNPGSLSYGSVSDGQSSTQTFSVINLGQATLTGSASVTGPFTIIAGGSYSIGGGATSSVSVAFNPVSPGLVTNEVIFGGNGGTSSNVVTGTGLTPPQLLVNPGSLTYSTLVAGQSSTQTFAVINLGQAVLSGSVSVASPFVIIAGTPYTVAGGATGTVSVAFSPGSAGSFSNNVIFIGNGGTSSNPAIGIALAPPQLTVNPGSLNYGSLVIGQSSTQTFAVINLGQVLLTGSVSVAGPYSIIAGTPYNVGGGATSSLSVVFNPVSSGVLSNKVIFIGNGGTSTNPVTGIGLTPPQLAVVPGSLDYGSVAIGQSSNRLFSVINTGQATLTGTATVGAPFAAVSNASYTVSGGATGLVLISFSPGSTGSAASNVVFTSNGGLSTNAVTGIGITPPQLMVNPGSLNYGSLIIGQSSNQLFTVINTGQATLTGTAAVGTPFAAASNASYSVTGGATGTVLISFNPTSAGTFTSNVIFTSNGGLSTNAVTGAGVTAPQLTLNPTGLNFGTIATGTTAQAAFVVTNAGGANLIGTATIGGPFAIVSGSPFNIVGFGATNLVVSFTPLSIATFTSNIVLATNGGNSTNTVTGSGAAFPLASFSAVPTSGPAPLTVTFTDSSTGTITNRYWQFGDGNTTNTAAPSVVYTYNSVGTDTVILAVSGPLGSSLLTNSNDIIVTNVIPQADLTLTANAAPAPIPQGQNLTYTLSLTNLGPAVANSVTVTDALPAGVIFVSAVPSQGNCTNIGGIVACNLGNLGVTSNTVVAIVVTTPAPGTVTNFAAAFTTTIDPNPTNNTATTITPVLPVADLMITGSNFPNPVLTSQNLTYLLTIANQGPSPATGVTVTDALPATLAFVSATASAGTFTNSGNLVTCALGSLASNASATVTIVVTPTAASNITSVVNSPIVSANEFDPVTSNNTCNVAATIYLDSVGDGLPDWWRLLYFGSGTTTNSVSCVTCDADGSGFSNWQDYLAGTNPTNANSALSITATAPSGGGFVITFNSVIGKSYALESTTNLALPSWFVITNVTATATTTQVTDPNAAALPAVFYRISLLP